MLVTRSIFKKPYAIKFEIREKRKKVAWAYLYFIFQDRHREPYGLMENVYVEQEYRNRGYGTVLIKEVIAEAKKRKCYKVIGTSKDANTVAHRFYERFRFKNVGVEFRIDLKKSKPLQRD